MYTSACWLALTSFEFMYEAKLLGLTTLVCLGVGLCWLWGLTWGTTPLLLLEILYAGPTGFLVWVCGGGGGAGIFTEERAASA
jgi:hypothetical protein